MGSKGLPRLTCVALGEPSQMGSSCGMGGVPAGVGSSPGSPTDLLWGPRQLPSFSKCRSLHLSKESTR